jgi:hypothetical protein
VHLYIVNYADLLMASRKIGEDCTPLSRIVESVTDFPIRPTPHVGRVPIKCGNYTYINVGSVMMRCGSGYR